MVSSAKRSRSMAGKHPFHQAPFALPHGWRCTDMSSACSTDITCGRAECARLVLVCSGCMGERRVWRPPKHRPRQVRRCRRRKLGEDLTNFVDISDHRDELHDEHRLFR